MAPVGQHRGGKTAKKNTQSTAASTKKNQQGGRGRGGGSFSSSGRGGGRGGRGGREPRTGVPLTSPNFVDEDIDDDLAFDSDDDKEFGAFFEAQAARRKLEQEKAKAGKSGNKKKDQQQQQKKQKGKNNQDAADDDDEDEDFDFDEEDDDDDYSSIGSLLDDDSEDEALRAKYGNKKKKTTTDDDVDFEDSEFDGEEDEDFDFDDDDDKEDFDLDGEEQEEQNQNEDAADPSTTTTTKKQKKQNKNNKTKAKPVADVTSAESLFPSSFVSQHQSSNKRSDADDLLGALTSSLSAAAATDADSSSQLDRLKKVTTSAKELLTLKKTKKNNSKKSKQDEDEELLEEDDDENDDDYLVDTDVLMPEADSEEVLKADRKQTRQMIHKDMEKWKEFLRTQRKNRTLKFPLKAPDQNPTAATLGGFANAVQHRQLSDIASSSTGDNNNNKKTATGTTSAPSSTGALATAQSLALQANALLGASGYGTTQAQKHAAKQQQLASKEESGEYVGFKGSKNNNSDDDDDSDNGHQQGGMDSQQFQETREHVAKLKAVLGYEIARRRRLNRIKSKTYRRILRMEKEKTQQKRQAAEALLDPERAQQRLQRKLDKQRAEERVLQRHKNTSKWILHAKRFAKFDEGAKDAIQDQHRHHAVLMQKMQESATADQDEALGISKNGQKNDDNSDDDDRVVDALFAGKGKSALWNNNNNEDDDNNNDKKISTKGMTPSQVAQLKLSEMDFMKRGREKARRENDAAADSLVSEVSKRVGDNNNNAVNSSSSTNARMKFTSSQNVDADLKATTASSSTTKTAGARRQREEDNNNNETQQQQQVAAPSTSTTGSSTTMKAKTKITTSTSSSTSNNNANNTAAVTLSKEDKNDRQDYLISRAFAQDDLDEDFDKKKTSQVESVMKPTDPNASLPGWGEWGGNDAKLNQQHRERVAAADLKRRMEKSTLLSARADASLDNVIINHDVDLVASKYSLHMVPRPFADATEFHRSMRQPVGPEWTTPQSFKRQIAPKIMSKAGVAIDPVDASTGLRKKAKTSMKKKDLEKKSVKKLGVDKK